MTSPVFIKRVELKNYKSIQACAVDLGPLTFLVGQNGAGKSNFLDALRLVSDSLNSSLEHALRERGGIDKVRRRSTGHPTHFAVKLHWKLPDGMEGTYGFKVGALPKRAFEVQEEVCHIFRPMDEQASIFYHVCNGVVKQSSLKIAPPVNKERLYLVAAAGSPEFFPLYDALSHMGFYNINPDEIREPQPPDPGEILKRDGRNLAGVLNALKDTDDVQRIIELLSKVVPGIHGVETRHLGNKEMLAFRQQVGNASAPWEFWADNMSDGTLRALGVLTALFQSKKDRRIPLVGIEEPETAVHPGAAAVLRDALRAAADVTQIIATTHSPDLLDDKDITDEHVRAVVNINGATRIARLDEASRSSIRDRLYTAGELLRSNQLAPDEEELAQTSSAQIDLFSEAIP